MFQIVLFQPEIPPNTGNIIRLCANTGSQLHLVRPLGFRLDDRTLARAGMDYRDLAPVRVHDAWEACRAELSSRRMFFVTTRGATRYDEPGYAAGDCFVFGPETRGLPDELAHHAQPGCCIRVPMATAARSLNLANAAAIVLYEAWRQNGFSGGW